MIMGGRVQPSQKLIWASGKIPSLKGKEKVFQTSSLICLFSAWKKGSKNILPKMVVFV